MAMMMPMMSLLFVIVAALSTSLSTALISQQLQSDISSRSSINNNKGRINKNYNEHFRLYASTTVLDVINSWKLMPDGRIKGVISPDGDNVLTTPLQNPNGLKETAIIKTISGSSYKLGTPDAAATATDNNNSNNKLSADRLGIPRGNAKATRPLISAYAANQAVRATVPVSSSSARGNVGPNNKKKQNDFLTPLVGGASAILIGAAIGTGVVNDKGISINNIKDISVDAKEILRSSKMLNLPDIKSLKAPTVPSVSLPQSIKLPTLPDVSSIGSIPSISAPEGIKQLGSGVTNAFNNAYGNGQSNPETKKITSVGQGPYRVPMPYLDQKIVQVERERMAQVEADKNRAVELEASRIQKLREEAELRQKAEQGALRQREESALQRLEEEYRARQEQEDRTTRAEEEAARLREEINQIRLTATKEQQDRSVRAQEETARLRGEIDKIRLTSMAKEKAAAEETTRLQKEAEKARLREVAAKEEFQRKYAAFKVADIKGDEEFSEKLAEIQLASERGKSLEIESTVKRRLADEAASREAVIIDEVRKASVGAKSARKSTYTDESFSTFEGWQERQRTRYEKRTGRTIAVSKTTGATPLVSFDKNLPTFQNLKQIASTPKNTMSSGETVTAVTGAPVPLANQLVSGTTKLSKVAALSYVAIGSAVVVGGLGFAWQGDDEQQMDAKESSSMPETVQDTKIISTPPPPILESGKDNTTSDSTTIDSQLNSDRVSSVTRAIPSRQPSLPSEFDGEPSNIEENSNDTNFSSDPLYDSQESKTSQPVVADSPQIESSLVNGASYLESMTSNNGVKNDSGESLKSSYSPFYDLKSKKSAPTESKIEPESQLKKSYSPFGNTKPRAHVNDTLYSAP